MEGHRHRYPAARLTDFTMSATAPVTLWQLVRGDLYRYGSGVSITSFIRHYLFTPGFRYTFWMRLANYLQKRGMVWRPSYYLSRAMLHRCGIKYGISIPYNTRIDPGLYIGHHGGIVLHYQVVMGRDGNINHDVTVGVKYGGKNPGVPVIGDRVYLGPGCRIIGGVHLGNDVAVGANAVVVESVPDGGVVIGVPGRLISTKGSSEYVVNTGSGMF